MATKKRTNEITRCHCCGVELSSDNCREVSSEFSQSGLSPYCVECESRIYSRFAQTQGKYHALLSACSAFNTPLKPILLDGVNLDEEPDAWLTYATLLAESGQDRKNGKLLGFADGVTTLWDLFGKKLGEPDFEKRIAFEKDKLKKQIGTEEQIERWGTLAIYKGLNWTNELYAECDRQLHNRLESLKGITITAQVENTLMLVCKNSVIYDHLMRQGLVKQALDVQKSIDLALSSEQLRKKDEKPIANFTPDAWIDAFEKAGIMKDGQFLPMSEIEQAMIRIMKGNGYPQTLDAAYQFEMNIIKNAARNGDQPIPFELPSDMKIDDSLDEFAAEETEEEKAARNYANLTPVRFENGEE